MVLVNDGPLVSIIMSAYNAGKYIKQAIDSVLCQSYINIELIICDDSSTDNTCEIIKGYKDERIKLIQNKQNSGSAYIPRYKAFMHSNGQYIMYLDADDFLSSNYVEDLVSYIRVCQADICCSCTEFVDEKGEKLKRNAHIPDDGFDFSVQLSGRKTFLYTVPYWKISTAGFVAKKNIWDTAFRRNNKEGERGIHDDENLFRFMFLSANVIVFSQSKYYYRMNPSSVTRRFNDKTIGFMDSELDLLNQIRDDFGRDSEEYRAVEANDYIAYCHVVGEMIKASNLIDEEHLKNYLYLLKKWHSRLNWETLDFFFNRMRIVAEKYFPIAIIIRLLKYDIKMSKKLLITSIVCQIDKTDN